MAKPPDKVPWRFAGQPIPKPVIPVVYNPMTGGRTDLEVKPDATPEEGAATLEKWRLTRIAYLRSIIPAASPEAQASYCREIAILDKKGDRV